jgi:hypothetical protein
VLLLLLNAVEVMALNCLSFGFSKNIPPAQTTFHHIPISYNIIRLFAALVAKSQWGSSFWVMSPEFTH